MDRRPEQGKRTVCVALPVSPLYLELGEMLLDVLSHLGFRPTLVQDGDQETLAADVLLLVGTGLCFEGYTNLLSHWQIRRPITILWQTEPLPPPILSTSAERRGLRAIDTTQMVWPSGWFLQLLKSVMPLSVRARLRKVICSAFFFNFRREIADNPQPTLAELDAASWYWPMRQYAWFKHHFPQGWLDFVFTSTVPRQQFLTSRGIPARFVPVGYHPRMGINLARVRDIDALFIGEVWKGRRKAMLDTVQRNLASKDMRLMTVEHGCYGAQRTNLLNRARISLNLDQPWELPGIRFLMSMGCGALVVSEPLSDSTPYQAGEHFVQANIADLPNAIGYYLEHEDEREAMVHAAYNLVTRDLSLIKTMSQIMEVCGGPSTVPAEDISRGD